VGSAFTATLISDAEFHINSYTFFGNSYPTQMCTMIHYTNNAITYKIQQNIIPDCCFTLNGQKILQHIVRTWPFCGQIMKIWEVVWAFSQVVWPQIFCLAFCDYFWKFGLIWMWYERPHSGIKMSLRPLSQARFPSWQLKFSRL